MLASASLIVLVQALATSASADAVTWKETATNSTYENGANWNSGAAPTGQGHFGTSNITSLSIGTNQNVGGWTFDAGASAYTIANLRYLQFTGAGIVINGGSLSLTNNATTVFNSSSGGAGSAAIRNFSALWFMWNSSANTATIVNEADLFFYDSSSAGSATITNNNAIRFQNSSNAGNARIIGGAWYVTADFSGSSGPAGDHKLTVGSLEGEGYVFLGSNQLTVGSNNLDTVLSAEISDCGAGATTCQASGSPTGGSLVKVGTGTMTLSGTNLYTGGTTFAGGVVSVSSDANLGNASGGLTFNGGMLQITGTSYTSTARTINWGAGGGGFDIANPANAFAVSQVLSGTGGLTKAGAGTLTLSGGNIYRGATAVNAGTLKQGAIGAFSSASAYTVASGATLDLGSYATTIGSLAGAGNVQLGAAVFTAGGDNGTTEFSGTLSGGGAFIKAGTGKTVLSGINTYSGATVVNAGTLSVNGSTASSSLTLVSAGGTLGGSGTVGTTQINGGTLAPGNSVGTLNVAGDLEFYAGSTYAVEVSPSNADRVNVTGTATLGGATVNASFANGSYIAKQYTILNATGGVSGKFGSLVNTNLPSSFTSQLSYDGNNAYLDLALSYVAPSTPSFGNGLNSNQNAVGNTLVNYFNSNGGIPLAFGALTATGLTQASGETTAGTQQPGFTAATQFVGTMSDPTVAGRGGNVPGPMAYAQESDAMSAYASTGRKRSGAERDAYAMITKAAPLTPVFMPRWNVWASGFGGTQTTDGNAASGTNTSSSRIGGVAVGADYWLSPETVAGFAMAGGATNFSVAGGGGGRSDLFQFGGFVRHAIGAGYVTASAAYGWQSVSTDRAVGAEQLRAKFDTNSYSARLEGGHRFATSWLGGIGVTPYAAAQVTYLDLPAYAESAASGAGTFALAYAAKGITAPRTELGLRSDKSFAIDDAVLILRGRAAWAHDTNTERSASATFQSLPGASFVVNGARPAANAALTTAEAEWRFASGISVGASFEGEFSDVTRSYAGKGVVRYAW
jgi:autotransporter-associated beta strand protein